MWTGESTGSGTAWRGGHQGRLMLHPDSIPDYLVMRADSGHSPHLQGGSGHGYLPACLTVRCEQQARESPRQPL